MFPLPVVSLIVYHFPPATWQHKLHKGLHEPKAPYTLPDEGSFVLPSFHFAVLYVRHRPSMGGGGVSLNGSANILPSVVVTKPGWGWSGACV